MPAPRRAALAGLAAALALTAACDGKRRAAGAARSAAAAPSAPPASGAAPLTAPRLTHLSAPPPRLRELSEPALHLPFRESFRLVTSGQPPRQRYQYHWSQRERVYTLTAALTARVLSEDTDAGDAPATPVPPFRETFALRAAPDGGRALHWRGEAVQVDGDRAAALPFVARWSELLAGRRARVALPADDLPQVTFAEDPLGTASQPEIDELTQRLLAWYVPLPAEPIGRGARWTAVTVLRQGAGVVKQTAKYEVLEQGADGLTLAIDVRRVAEQQRLDAPGLDPGAELELLAMFRASSGRVEVALDAALPVRADLTLEARAHQRLRLPSGGVREVLSEDLGTLSLRSDERR